MTRFRYGDQVVVPKDRFKGPCTVTNVYEQSHETVLMLTTRNGTTFFTRSYNVEKISED